MRVKHLSTRPAPASVRELLSRLVRGHGPTITIKRRVVPYWQERGWSRDANIYDGKYETRYADFWGRVMQRPGGIIEFHLYMPSREIQRCSHWPCFQHRGNDWYFVHMSKPPKDVSSGILAIERLITEAYEQ